MIVKKLTIPTAFVKMDTNVTAPDNCVNVADQRTFRLNNNILFAKRVRKDLVSQACGNTSNSFWRFRPRASGDGETWSRLMSIPLYVTQFTKQVTFWCFACKSSLDGGSSLAEDPKIYVHMREPQADSFYPIAQFSMTVTAATGSPAAYSVTVYVPGRSGERTLHFGRVPMIMDIYMRSYIDNTNTMVTGGAVVDAGRNWFAGPVGTYSGVVFVDDVVTVDSVTHTEPRQITHINVVGSNAKHFLDKPWATIPSTTDTVTCREMLGVNLYSFGVYELALPALYYNMRGE